MIPNSAEALVPTRGMCLAGEYVKTCVLLMWSTACTSRREPVAAVVFRPIWRQRKRGDTGRNE